MLVSVIVPNFNHCNFLVQRLDSIFNQTYQNFEVILLDDCSTDNSREILSQYAKNVKVTHCVFNEINSGNTFFQWNKGISLAKGDFIWIAESDDFCDLNFLEEVTKPLINNKEVILAYCQSNSVNENNEITGTWLNQTQDLIGGTLFYNDFLMESSEFIRCFLIYKNVIPNASAVVFRKKGIEIEKFLNVNTYFKYCGDWIFYFRLIINHEVAFISKSMNSFRYHPSSVITNANNQIDYVELKKFDIKMREDMMDYLSVSKLNNKEQIIINNSNIVKGLMFDQALYYYITGEKFKAIVLFIKYPIFFLKKYNLRKKIIKFLKIIKCDINYNLFKKM